MSPAFHDPPAADARPESARDAELAAADRRTVVRLPELAPVVPTRARRTVGAAEAEPDALVEAVDSCRRAACTPASAEVQPMGRSDAAIARRVTGATAAPGRGRAARNDGPDDDPPDDADSAEAPRGATAERRTVADAAAPAAAAPAPTGAVFIADRVRRANAVALLDSETGAATGLRSARGPTSLTERRTVVGAVAAVAADAVARPPSVAHELSWTKPAEERRNGIPE